ncbi:biotin transporter BioY [Carnobacteriaceae bacterium zg-C25]|nr:biotin transporter BioY [Carnobacteriaceae bacterium zg-C25]
MKTKDMTITALFSVLLFLSSFFKLPIGPVPVTTQIFFVLVIGLLLRPKLAFLSTLISLLLQCIFSMAYASLTFGFVIGFVISATVISLLTTNCPTTIRSIVSVSIGTLVIYICGTLYFHHMLPSKTLLDVITLTTTPFLMGDFIKAILAIAMAKTLRKIYR